MMTDVCALDLHKRSIVDVQFCSACPWCVLVEAKMDG
jgi:hypothetical protein